MLTSLLRAALFAAGVPEAAASTCFAAECTADWLRRRVLRLRRRARILRREARLQ